jgi:hypothetical protein
MGDNIVVEKFRSDVATICGFVPVTVTKAEIRNGERYNRYACAIAQALRRQFPKATVEVTYTNAIINGVWYRLPEKGSNLSGWFDSWVWVRPTSFMLRPVV